MLCRQRKTKEKEDRRNVADYVLLWYLYVKDNSKKKKTFLRIKEVAFVHMNLSMSRVVIPVSSQPFGFLRYLMYTIEV